MSAGFKLYELLYEPEALTGLIETLCSAARHVPAVICDLQKLVLALCVVGLPCHLLCKGAVALRITDDCETAYLHSLEKGVLTGIILIPGPALFESFVNFLYYPLKAYV